MKRRIGIILVGMGVLLSFPWSSNAQWMMAHRFEMNGLECLATSGQSLFAGIHNDDSKKNELRQILLAEVAIPGQPTAQVYMNNGDRAYWDGNFANAVLYYSKAIELDPKSFDARGRRAWAYLKLGGKSNYDRALADVAKVLELSPTSRGVYFLRGEIYRNLAYFFLDKGNRKEANDYLNKALADYQIDLEANPNTPAILASIGHVHFAKGDLDRALVDYSKLLEKKPEDKEIAKDLQRLFEAYDKQKRELDCGNYKHTWYLAGKFQFDKKHDSQAIKCYSKALELGLTNRSVYRDRAFAYQMIGEFDKALSDADMCIKLEPDKYAYSFRADIYLKRGVANQNKDDLDKAIADLSEAIKLVRKDLKRSHIAFHYENLADFYKKRALVFEAKQDWNEAIDDLKSFSELISPGPEKARVLRRIGKDYQKKGDANNAQKYFQQARAMDPNMKE